eukprot:CFRG4264T1
MDMLNMYRDVCLHSLSALTGIEVNALVLVLSLVAACPTAALYLWIFSKSTNRFNKVSFFTCVGTFWLWINYPTEFQYIVLSVVVTWLLLKVFGPTQLQAGLNFTLNMGFLLYSYRLYETDDYDINWTTAQCVMCLRNIAIGFDYMDGGTLKRNGKDKLSKEQLEYLVDDTPTLLEMFGFSLFFPAVLVGPQLTYRHFRTFLDTYIPGKDGRPTRREHVVPALTCLVKGIAFLVLTQVVNYPQQFFFSDEYRFEYTLWERIVFFWIHGLAFFFPYIGCWLVAESACIMTGVAYIGRRPDGSIHWGLQNAFPGNFYTALNLDGIVKSFNVNTNFWVMRVVFKRLRFLGSKNASQLGALFFLAIWHGFYAGYFITFALEFFEIYAERRMRIWASGVLEWGDKQVAPVRYAGKFLCWLSQTTMLANGILFFEILDLSKGWEVHKSLYFLPTLLPISYMIISTVLPPPMKKRKNIEAKVDKPVEKLIEEVVKEPKKEL